MTRVDSHVEAAPVRALERLRNQSVGRFRKQCVGVKKQQRIAARGARPGVHLDGAAARRFEQPVRKRHGEPRRGVPAAAVDHDDLNAAGAQRLERP